MTTDRTRELMVVAEAAARQLKALDIHKVCLAAITKAHSGGVTMDELMAALVLVPTEELNALDFVSGGYSEEEVRSHYSEFDFEYARSVRADVASRTIGIATN